VAAARENIRGRLLDLLAEAPPYVEPKPLLAPAFRRALAAAAALLIVGFLGVLLFNREAPPAIIESLTPATETPSATADASATMTATETATATPSPTSTVTVTASATQTATESGTPTETPRPGATLCVKAPPLNWVIYRVRSGDTLATLAQATGSTTAVLMRVNCLSSVSFLITGSTLYLPRQPFPTFGITPAATSIIVPPTAAPPQIVPTATSDDGDGGGDDNDNDDDSGESDDNDNDSSGGDDSTDEPGDDDNDNG
jgi:LysM repeat protein